MRGFTEHDQRLVSRFVDGELSGAELIEFERRLLSEPELRQAADTQRATRTWFEGLRVAEGERDAGGELSSGFADRILQEARRGVDRAAEADVPGELELAERSALRLGSGLLAAAVLIFGFALLFSTGLVRPADSGRLEAADERRIEQIDREIEAARRPDVAPRQR
jgi:anti-sigma factor RsiW